MTGQTNASRFTALRLVQAMSAWSVTPRGCRDVNAYFVHPFSKYFAPQTGFQAYWVQDYGYA